MHEKAKGFDGTCFILSIKRQINRENQQRATALDNKGHLRLKREAGWLAGWLAVELGRLSL